MRPSAPRWQRLIVGLAWLTLALAFVWAARRSGMSPAALFEAWLAYVATSALGPLLLFGLYLLRPLLLLPMTALTVFSGFLFGAALGLVYGSGAMLVSASLAYLLARFLAGGLRPRERTGEGAFWHALERRSFETILTSRLMFVPGDLVNYASGALRVPYRPFLLATVLGGLPGQLMGVLAGASIEGAFVFRELRFRPVYLLLSAAILVASLLVSTWLRRRQRIARAGEDLAAGVPEREGG